MYNNDSKYEYNAPEWLRFHKVFKGRNYAGRRKIYEDLKDFEKSHPRLKLKILEEMGDFI